MKKTLATFAISLIFTNIAFAESINQNYEKAIRDTAVMNAQNERPLSTLNNGTEHMVVWTDYTGYQPNDHYTMPLNLFVTKASDMRAACHAIGTGFFPRNALLKMRINQLLGLPKYDSPQQFVEVNIQVDQFNNANLANYSDSTLGQALFRPCGNPDVHGAQCGTDFANGTTDLFKTWIYQKTRQSYHASVINPQTGKINYGYPWTDLGYTYNWGSNDHAGLTEFVVKKGAEVQVVRQPDGTAYRSAQSFCDN